MSVFQGSVQYFQAFLLFIGVYCRHMVLVTGIRAEHYVAYRNIKRNAAPEDAVARESTF